MNMQQAIPVLVFLSVVTIGFAILLVRELRIRSLRLRMGVGSAETDERWASEGENWLLRLAGRLGMILGAEKATRKLRLELAQAGYHGRTAIQIFLGSKLLMLMLGVAWIALVVVPMPWTALIKAMAIIFGSGFLFFVPNIFLWRKRVTRQTEMKSFLPDAIDLLEICVSGGMGLDMAWNVVTDEITQVSMPLGDEMALTNLEIHLGAQRSAAMRNMSQRTGCQEVASLAAVLTQTERFGTSIGEALRIFASTMRESRSQRAGEFAEKMAVKLLFPLIFLIFPAIFVVAAGPAALELIKVMGAD